MNFHSFFEIINWLFCRIKFNKEGFQMRSAVLALLSKIPE